MYTTTEVQTMNCGDTYSMLYGCIVSRLVRHLGVDGERAAREGTRRFGRDRATTSRNTHLAHNLKINMLSLFTMFHDLPGDPRFRRELQELNPQERVSHTLVCPMADTWRHYGVMNIGRMYCEEFHSACYGSYAYGYAAVNLGKTLTQEGDEYCAFNVVLRPENLPDELKPVCFEEYDPCYTKPEVVVPEVQAKPGFSLLGIKLYYYLLEATAEQLGEKGIQIVNLGLADFAEVTADIIRRRANELGNTVTEQYAGNNSLFGFTVLDDPRWQKYSKYNAQQRFEEHYCSNLQRLFTT